MSSGSMCFDWGWSLSYAGVQGDNSVGILNGPRLGALGVFPGRKEGWVGGGVWGFRISGRKTLATVSAYAPKYLE